MKQLSLDALHRLNVEEYKSAPKLPIVLVLDNIRSMNNIGSVFRTADAFRIQEIHLCGITTRPPHREIHKTALGATESVAWRYFEHTTDAIAKLKEKHFKIWALEQTNESTPLQAVKPQPYTALILGNEVDGVSEEVLEKCDGAMEIPQFGTKHSLNVSVASGIAVWHLASGLFDLIAGSSQKQ